MLAEDLRPPKGRKLPTYLGREKEKGKTNKKLLECKSRAAGSQIFLSEQKGPQKEAIP